MGMCMDIEKKLVIAGVGRFQVMALLQAARHYIFYKDMARAKSFGLNRAIFYAWAKYHGPHTMRWRMQRLEEVLRKRDIRPWRERCRESMEEVLGECVEVSSRGYYVIGGREQTPEEYDQNIARKISRIIDYEKAWKAAINYVSQFPEWVLKDQQKFYKIVYEPVRDLFFKEILYGKGPRPSEVIMDKIRSIDELYRGKHRKQKTLFEYTS